MRKRRSKAKNEKGKYFLILAFTLLVLFAVLIFFSSIKNNTSKPTSNVKAGEYLQIVHTKSIGEFYNNRRTVEITELGLNITAVKGDAHSIIIYVDTQVDISNDVYKHIAKGETLSVSVRLKGYVTSLNSEGKFPVTVGLSCSEAAYDEITLLIDPDDIIGPTK
jgi:biopolymer transport protein ExbD